VCQFHSLSRCLSPTDVRTTLSSLPRTLDETYERILVNIPIDYQSKALTALQWIIYSVKELRLDQVSDAIIINPKADPPFSLANRPPEPRWILETLPGLVTIGSLRLHTFRLSNTSNLPELWIRQSTCSTWIRRKRIFPFSRTVLTSSKATPTR
jgi:hypothetical protein